MEYSEKIFEKETKFKKDPLSELEDNGEIRGSLWIKNRVEIEEKQRLFKLIQAHDLSRLRNIEEASLQKFLKLT